MNRENDAFLLTFPVTLVVTIIIALILTFTMSLKEGLSLGLGSVTSLMMMSMLFKSSEKVLEITDQHKARRQVYKNYAFRYFFYAFILVTSAIHDGLSVLFVAIGLFIFKLCLYLVLFITKKGGDTND